MMKNDDDMVGRVLSRREVLKLLGAMGAAVLVGCAPNESGSAQPTSTVAQTTDETVATAAEIPSVVTEEGVATAVPACVVRPEMTEGPYFVDEQLNRSDIRTEPSDSSVKVGTLLTLLFNVMQVSSNTCSLLAGAIVDVWQCDAEGIYSGVSDQGFETTGLKFLRGYQTTDENGAAQFTTIIPGWYSGRTVHIHFKIRTQTEAGQSYEFTSQLYFDDAFIDQIHAQEPYANNGDRDTRNDTDMHYQNGGEQLLLALAETTNGYTATFNIGLDLSDSETGASDSFRQGGGGSPPGG